jgi:uncharacterized repeat protein (TIGR04076 family)
MTNIQGAKVVAEIIDAGKCRFYKAGRKFILGGFTPAGLCHSAYMALAPDAQTMRFGGKIPWAKDGKVLTRCPDPEGVLWQLFLARESSIAETKSLSTTAQTGDGCACEF